MKNSTELIAYYERRRKQLGEKADNPATMFLEGYAEGLRDSMDYITDKACEWMKSHIDEGLVIYHNNTWCSLGEFIENFRKAMKENNTTEEQLNKEIPDSLGKIEFKQITTTWTENDHTTIVVLCGGKIMATANVRFSGDDKKHALLWNLWVLPSFRKGGLGKQIIDFATGIAKGHDCKFLFLDWSAEDTPGWVFDWYMRIGFKIDSYNYGSVRFKKKIK